MYELNATSTGALTVTGAGIAQGWAAVWTLLVAGLALVTVARVVRQRHDHRAGEIAAAGDGPRRSDEDTADR